MIDSAPVLAFVRDNLEQIWLGVGGLLLSTLAGVGLDALRNRTGRTGGLS